MRNVAFLDDVGSKIRSQSARRPMFHYDDELAFSGELLLTWACIAKVYNLEQGFA